MTARLVLLAAASAMAAALVNAELVPTYIINNNVGDPRPAYVIARGGDRPGVRMGGDGDPIPVGTPPECDGAIDVTDGTSFTLYDSEETCWHDLNVEAGVRVEVVCCAFDLSCQDDNKLWYYNGDSTEYCDVDASEILIDEPARDEAHTLYLDYQKGGEVQGEMACTVRGSASAAIRRRLDDPRPASSSGTPPRDRGTPPDCDGSIDIADGTNFVLNDTPETCWHDLNIAAGVQVDVRCCELDAVCDSQALWLYEDGSWTEFCDVAEPTDAWFTVDAQDEDRTIYLDWETDGSGGAMACTVRGSTPAGASPAPPPPSPPASTSCGVSAAGRIIDGDFASPNEFPWLAWMQGSSQGSGWSCGATIISEDWMLTAAHCVPAPSPGGSVTFSFGDNDKYSPSLKLTSPQSDIHIYPDYDTSATTVVAHDIALVKLPQSLSFDGATIVPACLPSKSPGFGVDFQVAGWGLVDTKSTSKQLKKANMVTVDNTKSCLIEGGAQIVCLRREGAQDPVGNVCSGDSGGYGGITENGQATIYGVTSFTYTNRDTGACVHPSGYTDVFPYMDWIQTTMANN